MDEIVKIVMEKTGLGEEQAAKAVEAVLEYVKDQVSEPFDSMIDSFMKGESSLGDIGGLAGGLGSLGGLFGKK